MLPAVAHALASSVGSADYRVVVSGRDTLWRSEDCEMPTIEGKEARGWIDAYVEKAGKLSGVAKAVRTLVKKNVAGCEEYVNPWKIPTFDLNGPLCFYMVTKEHVIFGFMRGAMLRDPRELLEGTGKYLRHVKLRSAADVRRSEVRLSWNRWRS